MAGKCDSMGSEDRARLILEYMAEYDIAMSPNLWFENMKRDRSITFSEYTVGRRIRDFTEKGWVERLDVDQGAFRITDAGKEAAKTGVSDSEMKSVIGLSDDD